MMGQDGGAEMTDGPLEPALNPETLETLKEYADPGDPRFLADLFRSFLDDGAERLLGLRSAAAAGDAPGTARLAHTFKGSSLNVGADALASLLHGINLAAKAGTLPGEAQLDACTREFGRVRGALAPYLD
jgi:HPt (histidine-containing phosphotransfer) domain-containing protein